jgi:hypothetical protein
MVSLVELCLESLITALAGTDDPRFARSLAHKRIVECVGRLPVRNARILTWQFGLDGAAWDVATIAERLALPQMFCERMLDDALLALGWELVAESQRTQQREVAA